MPNQSDFTKFLPGFDFMQGLLKNASSTMPSMSQWVTPTLDPQELDKRIEQLRTVHFWLEQNTRMIAATIQALEVQRMTLNTLQTMNVRMSDLGEALKMKTPWGDPTQAEAPAPLQARAEPAHQATPAPQAEESPAARERSGKPSAGQGTKKAAAGDTPPVDPMQWWGAITQQFGELAARALSEGADAAQGLREAAVKAASPGSAAAKAGASARSPKGAGKSASKSASKSGNKSSSKGRGRTSTQAGTARPAASSDQEP